MSTLKPQLLKGTRDFLPLEMMRREYIFQAIQNVFELHGFLPIETPAMERLETLMGKYGEEGDQLLFKLLNNGDFLSKVDSTTLSDKDSEKAVHQLSKRGLRYDLTVPLARFVALHQNDLAFPFKRFQIQPVWRADRPQKGRYQEFYQCDADVVGSDSSLYEADFIHIYDSVFSQLNLPVTIRVNHRGILAGMAEEVNAKEQFNQITIAIDKWDKIGKKGVEKELEKIGLAAEQLRKLLGLLEVNNLSKLYQQFSHQTGQQGVSELSEVFDMLDAEELDQEVIFDPKLARGLDYYTGAIFEVTSHQAGYGSLGGGGRYDRLTEVFGMNDMPGVGISFGAERIYDLLQQLEAFPDQLGKGVELLLLPFDDVCRNQAVKIARRLRKHGIRVDIYPEAAKFKKQMKYADQLGVPFVGIIGDRELANEALSLKDMKSGTQKEVSISDLMEIAAQDHSFEELF